MIVQTGQQMSLPVVWQAGCQQLCTSIRFCTAASPVHWAEVPQTEDGTRAVRKSQACAEAIVIAYCLTNIEFGRHQHTVLAMAWRLRYRMI
jgi:hypothetical protein